MRKLLGIIAFVALLAPAAQAQTLFQQNRDNVTLSCTTTSSSQAITPDNGKYSSMIVTNSGTAKAYIVTGTSDVAATVQRGTPILPDSQNPMGLPRNHTHIACITASGTATVEFSPGNGN